MLKNKCLKINILKNIMFFIKKHFQNSKNNLIFAGEK